MRTNILPACSCIVPFYNEGMRPIPVIGALVQVKNLSEIICIDGGSDSPETANEIKKKFPNVILVRLVKSKGKSEAVQAGLSRVTSPYVMLMDADLRRVIPYEIENGIDAITKNPNVGMIIFRRMSDPWFSKMIRGEILTSGERILRTVDLKNIFNSHPHGYQLEYAINFYMMKYRKNAYWVSYSAQNDPKIFKVGILKGLSQELTMYYNMVQFAGVWPALKSLFFFCRKEHKKSLSI